MKKITAALFITLPLCLGSAFAEEKSPPAQQTKMATCNKEATAQKLTGDERKQFMALCLKKDVPVKKAG